MRSKARFARPWQNVGAPSLSSSYRGPAGLGPTCRTEAAIARKSVATAAKGAGKLPAAIDCLLTKVPRTKPQVTFRPQLMGRLRLLDELIREIEARSLMRRPQRRTLAGRLLKVAPVARNRHLSYDGAERIDARG
jgi:hypothetical protein